MAIIQAQVNMKASSGLPKDTTVNTLHFSTADLLPATLDSITEAIKDLYNGSTAGGVRLSQWYGASVTRVGNVIKYVNLDDPPPRAPLRIDPWTLSDSATSSLPHEVAMVLSFQADAVSGTIQARRRGRIYIGPLSEAANQVGNPNSGLMLSMAQAGQRLAAASEAAAFWNWIVLSEANPGTPTRPAYPRTFSVVTNGWVDNAFDTQRRRGFTATSRTIWT